jgi:hypothetical protein
MRAAGKCAMVKQRRAGCSSALAGFPPDGLVAAIAGAAVAATIAAATKVAAMVGPGAARYTVASPAGG